MLRWVGKEFVNSLRERTQRFFYRRGGEDAEGELAIARCKVCRYRELPDQVRDETGQARGDTKMFSICSRIHTATRGNSKEVSIVHQSTLRVLLRLRGKISHSQRLRNAA